MKTKEYKAYWHAWHEPYLLYFLTDEGYAERVEAIKTTKPEHEIPTRLRLFQQVHGEIPVVLIQAGMKLAEAHAKLKEVKVECDEAYAKWKEADANYAKWEEADAKWAEVYAKWKEAGAEYDDVYMKYLPQIEKLHTEECGCTEWDGKKLVLPKTGE